MEPTHAKGPWDDALCGERWVGPFTEHPTCMLCIAGDEGMWGAVREAIKMNSVRDIQEMEDKKYLDAVSEIVMDAAARKR